MTENRPPDAAQDETLEARRAMLKYKSDSFNKGYKLEYTDNEARDARKVRDGLLGLLVDCMQRGVAADDAETLALVARYRFEFIDRYLYQSTLAILFGLSSVLNKDPTNKRTYDAYAEGFAAYLADAFRAYCAAERAKA